MQTGMPWSFPVDVFGSALIMAEMYLGSPLLPMCEDSVERLAGLERVIGPFPYEYAAKACSYWPGLFGEGPRSKCYVRFPRTGKSDTAAVRRVTEAVCITVSLSSLHSHTRVSYVVGRLLYATPNCCICCGKCWNTTLIPG